MRRRIEANEQTKSVQIIVISVAEKCTARTVAALMWNREINGNVVMASDNLGPEIQLVSQGATVYSMIHVNKPLKLMRSFAKRRGDDPERD